MITGLAAGIFWAADTIILGIALAMTPFVSTEQAVFLAPFVSTFLHDFLYGNQKADETSGPGAEDQER